MKDSTNKEERHVEHINHYLNIAIEKSMPENDEQYRHASCNVNPIYTVLHL